MGNAVLSDSKIVATYRERTKGSERLAGEAKDLFPSGVTHDARILQPYGIYVTRAKGSHKWDVDGNEYIDYFGGHGALLLGHNHPKVLAAIHEALDNGTHFGANHALEIRWAQLVQKLIPSAQRVRFTSSGTEATLMALRLARAWTGKSKLVRFKGHFHGWHDHMTSGFRSHFDGSPTVGVLSALAEKVVLLEPGDMDAARSLITSDHEIAAVILEPTGLLFSRVPGSPDFLTVLRDLTAQHGIVLIFDEVVTGFSGITGRCTGLLRDHARPDRAGQDPGGRIARGRGRRAQGNPGCPRL